MKIRPVGDGRTEYRHTDR